MCHYQWQPITNNVQITSKTSIENKSINFKRALMTLHFIYRKLCSLSIHLFEREWVLRKNSHEVIAASLNIKLTITHLRKVTPSKWLWPYDTPFYEAFKTKNHLRLLQIAFYSSSQYNYICCSLIENNCIELFHPTAGESILKLFRYHAVSTINENHGWLNSVIINALGLHAIDMQFYPQSR